jgi:hypothetical protein
LTASLDWTIVVVSCAVVESGVGVGFPVTARHAVATRNECGCPTDIWICRWLYPIQSHTFGSCAMDIHIQTASNQLNPQRVESFVLWILQIHFQV